MGKALAKRSSLIVVKALGLRLLQEVQRTEDTDDNTGATGCGRLCGANGLPPQPQQNGKERSHQGGPLTQLPEGGQFQQHHLFSSPGVGDPGAHKAGSGEALFLACRWQPSYCVLT
jgi:hypothetical protein